jgi:lipoate-protein ligase A
MPPSDGATNMALDEAILEAVCAKKVAPTLRLFSWQPPCLSLGFSQSAGDVDRQACAVRGWEIVRRPTGGRAILHVDELTYSVSAPADEPRVAGGIVESYGRLAAGLLAGLRVLGLAPAEARPLYAHNGARHEASPVCFEGPARYEIIVRGRKLVGSAQSRRLGGILQHGTLPLTGDITRILEVLRDPDPVDRQDARNRLLDRATTLETALGRHVTFDQAAEALVAGFSQALDLEFVECGLADAEYAAAARVREAKYACDTWTYRI